MSTCINLYRPAILANWHAFQGSLRSLEGLSICRRLEDYSHNGENCYREDRRVDEGWKSSIRQYLRLEQSKYPTNELLKARNFSDQSLVDHQRCDLKLIYWSEDFQAPLPASRPWSTGLGSTEDLRATYSVQWTAAGKRTLAPCYPTTVCLIIQSYHKL